MNEKEELQVPNAENSDSFEDIQQQSITVFFSRTYYDSGTRQIVTTAVFSSFSLPAISNADFTVQRNTGTQQSPNWQNQTTGWSLGVIEGGEDNERLVFATHTASIETGSYRFHIAANAISQNVPSAAASSTALSITAPYGASWTSGTITPASDRSASIVLNLSENPGSTFNAEADFEVERRTGTDPNFQWEREDDSDWSITSTGTGRSRTIKVTPISSVDAGTYRIVLLEDAFGTDKPDDDVASQSFTIGLANIIVTVPVPQGSSGAIQISLKARSFNVSGMPTRVGPQIQQHLGTVYYDTDTATADILIGTWEYANYCPESDRINASIRFNKEITGLNVNTDSAMNGDIEIQNENRNANLIGWTFTFSGHTGTGTTATLAANTPLVMSIQPPTNTNRLVYLVFTAGSVTFDTSQTGPPNAISTETISVDNSIGPPGPIFTLPEGIQMGSTSDISMDFEEKVYSFTSSDLNITGGGTYNSFKTNGWNIVLAEARASLSLAQVTIAGTDLTAISVERGVEAPETGVTEHWQINLNKVSDDIQTITTITGGQNANQNTIARTSPTGSLYTVTINNPAKSSGTINMTLRRNSVQAFDDHTRGPEQPQNSGSYAFNTDPIPYVVDSDYDNRLVAGLNNIGIDFNIEVQGVLPGAFEFEGMNGITLAVSNIFYSATQDPDVRPSTASRTTPVSTDGTTQAKYYRISIMVPDPVPAGILSINLVDGIINTNF